jgi:hypothetical protein
MLVFAIAFGLVGCETMPSDPAQPDEQATQRGYYGTAPGTGQNRMPVPDNQPQREQVPGEQVPDR